MLTDGFGRRFAYLRLSLTEACNFRCGYCLPDGYRGAARAQFLQPTEIARLLRAFAAAGLRKVRLTGGEPTLRRDLDDVIALAATTPGVERVVLTTNGVRLPRRVAAWRDAGLSGFNVSVDSLQRERFAAITGQDRLPEILDGIDVALALGLEVKLNAVLLRGLNDDAMPAWLDYIRARPVAVRFIELMRTNDTVPYFEKHHVRAEAVESFLRTGGWCRRLRAADGGPAVEFVHPDYAGRVGIIAPYGEGFCTTCNRLRVTARGDLRLCLFGDAGTPLRDLLQHDDQQAALLARLHAQVARKAAGHGLHASDSGATPHLASIGG